MTRDAIIAGRTYEGRDGTRRHVAAVHDIYSDGVTRVDWYAAPVSPAAPGRQCALGTFARWAVREVRP